MPTFMTVSGVIVVVVVAAGIIDGWCGLLAKEARLLHPCPTFQSCGDRTMTGIAQTAIPADAERPTSASVQATTKVRR